MATSTSDVTGNSALAVRGNNILLSGLVSAAVAGSIIIGGGNLHFDTSATTNPAIKAGTSSILQSYDGQAATVATSSGGRVNYTSMSALNPSTATQSILNLAVDAKATPVASNDISCGIGPSGFTNSGSPVFGASTSIVLLHKLTVSGSTVTASGNNLSVIPPGWGVRCWWKTAPGVGVKSKLRVQTRDQYIP